eukprot:1698738-Heterocapsa_arctica.AAC.1
MYRRSLVVVEGKWTHREGQLPRPRPRRRLRLRTVSGLATILRLMEQTKTNVSMKRPASAAPEAGHTHRRGLAGRTEW